jgi:hypothetical protein
MCMNCGSLAAIDFLNGGFGRVEIPRTGHDAHIAHGAPAAGRFLDVRRTGIARAALAPVQRRFALQFVQPAVLSSTVTVAVAVVNQDAVLCRCGGGGAPASGMQWVL